MDERQRTFSTICFCLSLILLSIAVVLNVFATENAAVYPYEPIIVESTEDMVIDPIIIESEVIEEVTIEESTQYEESSTQSETRATRLQPPVEKIEQTEPPEPERELYLTESEKQMLAQLVHAESGTESYYVKQLVVDVVLNRVDSPLFPNTIEEVIYQKRQFSVIRNGSFDRALHELEDEDWLAVDEECYGRQDYGILYFNDDSIGGCANGKGGWKVGQMWFAY